MARTPLPGDQIAAAARRAGLLASTGPLEDRERGSLDPQTVAEFLAYDVPFDTEPATGFTHPAGVERG